jgi:hypothetical protein
MNNIIKFPKVETTADKADHISSDLIESFVNVLHNHGIDIKDEDIQLDVVSIIRLTRAMLDNHFGIENDLSEPLKELAINIKKTI